MDYIKNILENNKIFVKEMLEKDADYFKKLSLSQKPQILYIGCSDSRMPINLFTKTMPGEIFIHRNIGNQVFVNDMNVLSVIEYSIKVLDVKYIVIAGHYKCGAIRSAVEGTENSIIDNWISSIKELYVNKSNELLSIKDFEKRLDVLSEINVIYQIERLLRTSLIKERLKKKPYSFIIGWIIDIYTGYIKELPLPLEYWKKLDLLPEDY